MRHLLLLLCFCSAAVGDKIIKKDFVVRPRCGRSWPFCPYPHEECRNGGYWCPHGHTCSPCDYPEIGNCCYKSCGFFSSYLGQPCRRGHNCYPCGSSSVHPLCCKERAITLGECKAECPGPYKECYLFGCPFHHRGWCCRWRACWGPWCAPCAGGLCTSRAPSLSSKAMSYMAKGKAGVRNCHMK